MYIFFILFYFLFSGMGVVQCSFASSTSHYFDWLVIFGLLCLLVLSCISTINSWEQGRSQLTSRECASFLGIIIADISIKTFVTNKSLLGLMLFRSKVLSAAMI